MKNKRGELTSGQLVALVFAIVGFLIAGAVTFKVLGKQTNEVFDRETCHLSVLSRATVPDSVQQKIPLKCTTDKFCFTTSNDGTCTQFAGETNVQRVSLPKDDAPRAARLVERISANALYDCWTMMGEGKLDLFGSFAKTFALDRGSPTCVVCSRLAIADDIRNNKEFYESLKQNINVNSFLENTPVTSGGPTYLALLSQKGITGFRPIEDYKFSSVSSKEFPVTTTDSDQIAFIFSQVRPPSVQEALKSLGFAVTGGAFVLPGGTALALTAAANPLVTIVGGGIVAGAVTTNAFLGKQAAAGYCGNIETTDSDKKEGCSLVRAVNYNLQDLNAFCPGSIQGTP